MTSSAQPVNRWVEADWAKPFTQPLSAFNGQNWSQMLTTLDNSAGGEWIPIDAPTLAAVALALLQLLSQEANPLFHLIDLLSAAFQSSDRLVYGSHTALGLFHGAGHD